MGPHLGHTGGEHPLCVWAWLCAPFSGALGGAGGGRRWAGHWLEKRQMSGRCGLLGAGSLPPPSPPPPHRDYPKCFRLVPVPSRVVLGPGSPAHGNRGDQVRPKDLPRVGLRPRKPWGGPGSVDKLLNSPKSPGLSPLRESGVEAAD